MQKRKTAVMASIVSAMLVASMDTTITNTTMPIIAEELGGMSLYAWTFTAYMVLSTVLSPLAGRISDMYGRKKIFAFGTVLFLFGSLLCGLADTMLQLVLFRAVQGIGAGIMLPFPIIIAGDLFPVEKRGKIQALFTGMWGLAAILAPLLGSLFVEYATWRWIFFVNIPICLTSLLLLRSYEDAYEPKRAQIDAGGSALFAAGISLLLVAVTVERFAALYAAAGAAVMIGFFLYERRHPSPVVPLSLFANRPVRWMLVNAFTICTAVFGTSSYVPLFLRDQGYTTFQSGFVLLAVSAGWMITAVPAGKWVLKYGYFPLILAGNGILLTASLQLALIGPATGIWYIASALFVQGIAFGLVFTVGIIGAQQLVEPHQKGISSSLQLFGRNIGTAVSVTVMGALLLRSGDAIEGYRSMFLYGLVVSVIALLTVFPIRSSRAVAGVSRER